MIKIGTVCYVVGEHVMQGRCCTVIGPLRLAHAWTGSSISAMQLYPVEFGSGEVIDPVCGYPWAAQPSELIPIAPPGITDDEKTREPVAA